MHNWLDILKNEFDHPAIVLWRAVELRHIEEFLKKHELSLPILDLGCAEGKIAGALFEDKKLIGLDNSWELISENKKANIYKALILADGCRMPFKNSTFGSVFSNCVIEHILDIDNVLKEVSRVLKDNGVFLFTVPSHKFGDFLFFSKVFKNLGLKRLAQWYGKKRNTQLNHFHCYDHNRWKQMFKEKGLELIEYRYYMTEEETFVWDFLAAVVFVLRSIWPLRYLIPKLNRWLSWYLCKFYNMDSQTGGGLLLLAQKGV